jgi:hypothetical protein
MATVTAVDGGHVESIDDSNRVIREIVEARNASKAHCESILADDDDGELEADVRSAANMDGATPLPGAFDENPKDLVGTGKLPLHLWPTTATAMGCIALLNGALKYGRSNWRVVGVRASIYVDACQRHLAAWFEGRECDEEGVPHLSSALACLAILVDAEAAGKLKDDRQVSGGHAEIVNRLTPHVERLRALHASKSPKHYTIGDNA